VVGSSLTTNDPDAGGILDDFIGSRVHLPLLAREAGEEHAWW
jgi:hypothetical protein